MAGIFGYHIKTKEFDITQIKNCLIKHAQQEFNHPTNMFSSNDRHSGLGFALPYADSSWPLTSEDGNYYFQLFGQIILPDGSKLTGKNFNNKFLKPFLISRNNFLHQLDGAYVFVIYNLKTKTFTLVNDPFGNFSLYYFSDDKLTIFSSQLNAITEIIKKNQWDVKGFGQYLGLGFSMNGTTVYKNIRRLQAAEIVTLSLDQIHSEKYYMPHYKAEDNVKIETENIKNAVISSIESQINNNDSVGAALTGGFDSRVTWAVIGFLNGLNEVSAFTHGLENSRDIRIAKKLAKLLKINHQLKIFDDQFVRQLPDLWEPFIKMTEGMVPITAAHAVESWKFGQKNYQLLLDSHGGALYRRQFMKVTEKTINDSKPFSEQFFKYAKSGLIKLNILKPDVQKDAINSSLDGLNEYFGSISHNKFKGDKADLFYINQVSTNKYSVAGNAQMNWLMLSHPFLNLDAFNAVQKIPGRFRANQSIYQFIINQTNKRLKTVWLENMGMPAPYYGFVYFRYIPMIYELLLQKSVTSLNESLYKMLTLRHFVTDYDLFFRINFAKIKEILLRSNDAFYEFFNITKVEDFINHAELNPDYKLSSWSDLITLKLYFDLIYQK